MTARQRERRVFLIIIVGIVLLFLLDKCMSDRNINPPDENVILHTIDTVIIKGKSDTVTFTDTILTQIVKFKYIDTTEDEVAVRIYESEIDDSLITGTIYTKLEMPYCNIIDQNLRYTAKFPKFITRVDTFKIEEVTIKEQVRNKLFFGVEMGGNLNSFSVGPKLSLQTKKDILCNYRYDIIQNTHNIGVSFKLINPFKK